MALTPVTMTIPGTPKPKGSLKCLGRRGRVAHQLVEDYRPGQKEWRDRIADTVRTRVKTRADAGEPVSVEVLFVLPRPQAHYGTGRNTNVLKPQHADAVPTGVNTGDLDKLCRLLLDALADGGLLDNDAQVVTLTARKAYVGPESLPWPGAWIHVRPA